MIGRIARWLKMSSHVHLRTKEISSKQELIDLIDRWMDGRLDYPLEWDDFISFESSDSHLEASRLKIGHLEPLLLSGRSDEIDKAIDLIMLERNRLAALCAMTSRLKPSS